MIKAICFKDVRPGDVVCRSIDERFTISAVGNGIGLDHADNGLINLSIEGATGLYLVGLPDRLIGLIHQPWPQGRTVLEMLGEIARLGSEVQPGRHMSSVKLAEAITKLREAIEVFELGFPPTDGE